MINLNTIRKKGWLMLCLAYASCKVPALVEKQENNATPSSFTNSSGDTTNVAALTWKTYFSDPNLTALIDTALVHNQELNITLQEIEISKNEVKARHGEILPSVQVGGEAGVEKVGRYTSQGAGDATTEIKPGKEMPDPLPNLMAGFSARWEIDIWHKLHNAKKAAIERYLASQEGRHFMVTNLVAEIANSYYELLSLDNQLQIVQQNIQLLDNALTVVRIQKEASRVTELAVSKFEAEVLNTQARQYQIKQQITETENRINFLLGRFPQPVKRSSENFSIAALPMVTQGIPAQLLQYRPDIRQAEHELAAARLDVQVARAQFYPSVGITASLGYNAFNPAYFLKTPESLLFSLAGDLAAPLINKNGIKAAYYSAGAKQIQAVYNYERTILQSVVEVENQLSNMGNLEKSFDLKSKAVDALTRSINISNDLFKSARADYLEVLMTQRDALESKLELIETKKMQWNARVSLYQALGGGWK